MREIPKNARKLCKIMENLENAKMPESHENAAKC